jgi:hypothetical protein
MVHRNLKMKKKTEGKFPIAFRYALVEYEYEYFVTIDDLDGCLLNLVIWVVCLLNSRGAIRQYNLPFAVVVWLGWISPDQTRLIITLLFSYLAFALLLESPLKTK